MATPRTVVVGANLLFGSKFQEVARSLGLEVELRPAAAPGDLSGTTRLFVDLEKVDDALLATLRAAGTFELIGFGSHVAEERLASARAAGCNQVLTRGQLTARLAELLGAAA